jgi:hypothetical protein
VLAELTAGASVVLAVHCTVLLLEVHGELSLALQWLALLLKKARAGATVATASTAATAARLIARMIM